MTTRTLAEIADLCGAELHGDGARVIDGPASLSEATPREISFLANPRYQKDISITRAAAVLVARDFVSPRPDLVLLRCADPNSAFNTVIQAFARTDAPPTPGIDPRAVIDETAEIGEDVSIGPACVVGAGCKVGDQAVLHAGVVLQRGASVGPGSVLHPSVVLYAHIHIGARCIIHSGAVIGADGYGFEPTPDGWSKIPQCGTVVIEDDVEIGANVTIDRGRFGATRVGRGAKIDNLVHIAHNVVIGEGARIAAQAGVFGDVPAGADYLGWPARPRKEALRQLAMTQKLPEIIERLRELEQRLSALEKNP